MTSPIRDLTLALATLVAVTLAPTPTTAGEPGAEPEPEYAADPDAAGAKAAADEELPPIMQDGAARRARRDAQREEKRRAYEAASARPPTEAELGAPVYPGARFDARNSAGMSSGDQWIWLYLSNDAPEKVAAFYQAKLGKAPQVTGEFRMFVLKGRGPLPEHGLLVEPNREGMYPAPTKTVISVQKHKDG